MREFVLIASLAFVACSGKDDSPTAVDPACKTHSKTELRVDIPEGACVASATCEFSAGGISACQKPGARFFSAESEWSCTCDGSWHCQVAGGTLGVQGCPGYENCLQDPDAGNCRN